MEIQVLMESQRFGCIFSDSILGVVKYNHCLPIGLIFIIPLQRDEIERFLFVCIRHPDKDRQDNKRVQRIYNYHYCPIVVATHQQPWNQ